MERAVDVQVDGARRTHALAYIVATPSRPGLHATSIFTFTLAWNDYFFSPSRSRPTRSTRDWSSDVCSSDLGPARPAGHAAGPYRDGRAVAVLPGRDRRHSGQVRGRHLRSGRGTESRIRRD